MNWKQPTTQAVELLEVRALLAADSSLVGMAVLDDSPVEDDINKDWYLQPFEFDAIFPRALPFDPSGLPARVIEPGESIAQDEDGDQLEPFDPDGIPPQPFDVDGLMPIEPDEFDIDGLMPIDPGSFLDFKFDEIFGAADFFHRLDDFDITEELGELPIPTDLDGLSIQIDLIDNGADEFDSLDISLGDTEFTVDFPIHDFFVESNHGFLPLGRPLFVAPEFDVRFDFQIDLHEIPFDEIGAQFEQIVDATQDFAPGHPGSEHFEFEFIQAMHFPHLDQM